MVDISNKYDVFISYAHEDRERAHAIAGALEQHGLRVWWDRELIAGERFRPQLQERLDAALAVVVLWTAKSIGKTFVRDEANRSLNNNKLVPVLIDDVKPPLGFGETNHLDLRGWRGDELAFEIDEVVDQIRKVAKRDVEWVTPSPWILSRSVLRDMRTRIVLTTVLIVFVIVWFLWGNQEWQSPDFLWAAALALSIISAWLLMRASQFSRRRAFQIVAVSVSVFGLSTWALAFANYYRSPNFESDETGLLVARVDGDSQKTLQDRWLQNLRTIKVELSVDGTTKKMFSPVTILPLHRKINSPDFARGVAERANALIVLWSKSSETFMTFADVSSITRTDDLPISNIETLSLEDANTETNVDLAPALLSFAAAFGEYSRAEYLAAREPLLGIIEMLTPADTSGRPAKSLLAATHLLLGNTYAHVECNNSEMGGCEPAMEQYIAARKIFSQGDEERGNLFVAASNNLAISIYQRDKGFGNSIGYLKDAEITCGAHDPEEKLPIVCAFVYFNLAHAYIDIAEYKLALRALATACDKAKYSNIERNTSYFLNRCHQQKAYASAKLGEREVNSEEALKLFKQAKAHIEKSEAELPVGDDPGHVPAPLIITQARIAVGLKDFESASELLGQVTENIDGYIVLRADVIQQYPALEVTDISILMMISNVCLGATESKMKSMGADQASFEMVQYMTRSVQQCSAN